MVVAWCEQLGDPSIVLTRRERKDRFEHIKSKEPNGSFLVGHKRRNKLT